MENKNIEKPWWREGVILFTKVSAYIAVPVIVASLVGKSLDRKYSTGNFIFLALVTLAFLTTIYLIWKEVKAYQRRIQNESESKKE